jgi:hypothetical protein
MIVALGAFLPEDLRLAAGARAPMHVAAALAAADPLRLDLPPVVSPKVTPEALRSLSALYLAARLEEMGVLAAAESLVAQRASLRVAPATAAKLDELARSTLPAYPREQRVRLFATLFGLGSAAGAVAAETNARFEPLLAALCSSLVACGARTPTAMNGRHTAVAVAARDLAAAAGLAYSGGATVAAGIINDQLRRAVDLLSDAGIGTLVGTRGLWPTLRTLLGPAAPDLRRLLDCGRHGQRVLRWLADVAPTLERRTANGPLIPPDLVVSADAWLAACGLRRAPAREGWI